MCCVPLRRIRQRTGKARTVETSATQVEVYSNGDSITFPLNESERQPLAAIAVRLVKREINGLSVCVFTNPAAIPIVTAIFL